MAHTQTIFNIKIPKEKGLVVVFQRGITRKDRIKLAGGRSDMKHSEISPLRSCFLPFKPEVPSRQSSGPSSGLNKPASLGESLHTLPASLFVQWGWRGTGGGRAHDHVTAFYKPEDINVL